MGEYDENLCILDVPICPEHKSALEPRVLKVGKIEGHEDNSFLIPLAYYCRECNGYYSNAQIIKDSFAAVKEYCKNSPRALDILKRTKEFMFL